MARPSTGALVPLPRASHPALTAEGVQPEHQLRAELAMLDQLRGLVAVTYTEAVQPAAAPPVRALYLQLVETAAKQGDRVQAAAQQLRRALVARRAGALWAERRAELTARLAERYEQLGPQYELLIRRLVEAEVWAEQLEASARDVSATERRAAMAEVRASIAALQRYTETEKRAQLTTQVDAAVMAVLREVEALIAPEAPELWHRTVKALQARLDGEA